MSNIKILFLINGGILQHLSNLQQLKKFSGLSQIKRMIEQQVQCENYGYEIPSHLFDPNWRKCFDNQSQNKSIIIEGVIKIRKYLSQETQAEHLIKVIISTEIHKTLFRYAKRLLQKITSGSKDEDDVACLYQLIWIFTNLCSGSKQTTNQILELGIVQFCKDLFNLEAMGNIISSLFELIGNLAGQLSLNLKISFLADPKFYSFMKNSYYNYIEQQNFHVNATWSFSNLFRDFEQCQDKVNIGNLEDIILAYFPIIQSLLQIEIEEAVLNLLQIFNYISRTQVFHMDETFKIIDKYLTDPRDRVSNLVFQIMGNYISHCDQAVDYSLNHPLFLDLIFKHLNPNQKTYHRKQAAWILSNIFAGNVNQIQKVVSIPTIFNRLYEALISQENQRVLKQLIWTVSNSFSTCSEKSFEIIFHSCIIEPLSFRLSKCKQKVSFQVYVNAVFYYLKKFQKNPNLHFDVFLKNITCIQPVLTLSECKYPENTAISTKVYKLREKIEQLIKRGPITEEQMAKKHLQNFKI